MGDEVLHVQLWTGIQRALECYSICTETVTHCLERGGVYAAKPLIQLLIDCSEICQTAAGFLLRGSSLQQLLNTVCAEACERCARSCEQFDDDLLQQCAEVCLRCAEACRALDTDPPAPQQQLPRIAGGTT